MCLGYPGHPKSTRRLCTRSSLLDMRLRLDNAGGDKLKLIKTPARVRHPTVTEVVGYSLRSWTFGLRTTSRSQLLPRLRPSKTRSLSIASCQFCESSQLPIGAPPRSTCGSATPIARSTSSTTRKAPIVTPAVLWPGKTESPTSHAFRRPVHGPRALKMLVNGKPPTPPRCRRV